MADLSDILAWFESQCETVCYPTGKTNPPITGNGKVITIGRGWPDPKSLDAVMAAGNAFISVYPMPGMEKNTTRFPKQWQQKSLNPAQTTVVTTINTVTIGGTPTAGEAVVVTLGQKVYGYAIKNGDNAAAVAAAMAALIPAATAVGAVLTINGMPALTGAVVSVTGIAQMETRRQERVFGVYVWAPDPATRTLVSSALDLAFADIERFAAADGSWARLIYRGTQEGDELQVRKIYKRWLMYSVEYATTKTETTNTTMGTSIGLSSSPGI